MNINEYFEAYWKAQIFYSDNSNLDNLDWNQFIKVVSTMNIKSCGTKIEQRILRLNNWNKIEGHSSHGDGRNADGKIFEVKSSIITPNPKSRITFRGIRAWHLIDCHCFVLINLQNFTKSVETSIFILSKEQMNFEKERKVFRPYTMKKADRLESANVELGSSFKKGDLERWKSIYLVDYIKT